MYSFIQENFENTCAYMGVGRDCNQGIHKEDNWLVYLFRHTSIRIYTPTTEFTFL